VGSSELERKVSIIHNKCLLVFPPTVNPYAVWLATDCPEKMSTSAKHLTHTVAYFIPAVKVHFTKVHNGI
jgi:hypothetical protein